MKSLIKCFATTASLAIIAGACGDTNDELVNGFCVREDSQQSLCIIYAQIPAESVDVVETACTNEWGGQWKADGPCQAGTEIGMCTLEGDATDGANQAVMHVFAPTNPATAENELCVGPSTWEDVQISDKQLAEACESDAECASGLCFTEWGNGFCSTSCDGMDEGASCDVGGACLIEGDPDNVCMPECSQLSDCTTINPMFTECRTTVDSGGVKICLP